VHIGLHGARTAHADESIRSDLDQLFDGDGRRGAADARGDDRDLFPQQGAGPGGVLAVLGHEMRGIEELGDLLAASGVTGQQDVTPDVAFFDVQVKSETFFIAHFDLFVSLEDGEKKALLNAGPCD